MNRLRIGIGLAGLIAAAGCNAIVGIREGTLIEGTGAAGGQGGSGQGGAAQGAQTSSSNATSSTGNTSTGMVVEDCLDGQDNDGDGNIDCADAACQPGFECTDQAPAGWDDYVRIHTTPYGMSAGITCPDGLPPLHYFEGPAGPVECSACQCNLQGATCGAPEISCYFGNATCTGTADSVRQAMNMACISNLNITPEAEMSASCKLTGDALILNQGTCSTSGGTMTNPNPPLWAQDVLLCGGPQTGAGCAAGQVCVPKGGGDFAGDLCITRAGPDMCPTGWNTQIHAYGAAMDSRACTACGCTASCTGGGYTTHDRASCTPAMMAGDFPDTPITSSTCVDIGYTFDSNLGSLEPELAQAEPLCSGGNATGQVTPQDPHVICCP